MNMGRQHLMGFKRKWQWAMILECLILALGFGAMAYLPTKNLWAGGLLFLLSLGIALWLYRPWRLNMERVVAHIDARLPVAEFSSGLLVRPETELTGLARLQRHRVETQLAPGLSRLRPPHRLGTILPAALGLIAIGMALHFILGSWAPPQGPAGEQIVFGPTDSLTAPGEVPRLLRTTIRVRPPAYTGKGTMETTDPNIRAVEGSRIEWVLEFEGEPISVEMDRMGETVPLVKQRDRFSLDLRLEASGFYSFTFVDARGQSHSSDLHSLEALPDVPPTIELKTLSQFNYFEPKDQKTLPLAPKITDDFGLSDAYIVATVSKGSGESVKFREEVLRFQGELPWGQRSLNPTKALDLDLLGMEPGDELYFHIVAVDNKRPTPQSSRSGTFFAHIRDSVAELFAVEGGMGVDLMPQYFRSQRQLIIDTEKLIADRPLLPKADFNSKSNELGFDQKALRLKYGQFMGDETETQAAPGQVTPGLDGPEPGGEGGDDPLEGFRHDHDGDNEHNLLPEQAHDHEAQSGEEGEKPNPLLGFLHNHDDPEEATLFEQSLKDKLRAALDLMWDAELHLRLYDPQRSLPYQYKALELLEDIKNSARIYVHRIGFDPPPIKEDRRLTGDIAAVGNHQGSQDFEYMAPLQATREAVARLEVLRLGEQYGQGDRDLFHRAGNELAQKAVDRPLEYLGALQGLRSLDRVQGRTPGNYTEVQRLLLSVLGDSQANPGRALDLTDPIDLLYLKALDTDE